jgi:hypothetical protein
VFIGLNTSGAGLEQQLLMVLFELHQDASVPGLDEALLPDLEQGIAAPVVLPGAGEGKGYRADVFPGGHAGPKA